MGEKCVLLVKKWQEMHKRGKKMTKNDQKIGFLSDK